MIFKNIQKPPKHVIYDTKYNIHKTPNCVWGTIDGWMIGCVNFKLPQNTKCVHIKDTLIRNHSFQGIYVQIYVM